MDKILSSLRAELLKEKDPTSKRLLQNAIYFVVKVMEQQKSVKKKAERKLDQAKKERDAAMKEALANIEKKRHRIK